MVGFDTVALLLFYRKQYVRADKTWKNKIGYWEKSLNCFVVENKVNF